RVRLLQPHGGRARDHGQGPLSFPHGGPSVKGTDARAPLRTLERLIEEQDLQGKRVLVRVDFNVPLEQGEDGLQVVDDTRIRAALPTIDQLQAAGATLVLVSHLGRPKGAPEDRYRMAPVARRLGELLGQEVRYLKTDGPASPEQQRDRKSTR